MGNAQGGLRTLTEPSASSLLSSVPLLRDASGRLRRPVAETPPVVLHPPPVVVGKIVFPVAMPEIDAHRRVEAVLPQCDGDRVIVRKLDLKADAMVVLVHEGGRGQ